MADMTYDNGEWVQQASRDNLLYNPDNKEWINDDAISDAVNPVDALKSAASGFATGLTWGGVDELAGAVTMSPPGMAYSLATGTEGLYKKARNYVRESQDEIKNAAPASNAVGDVLGSILSGKGLYSVLKYASLAPKTAIGSIVAGAGEGGLQSLGRSAGPEDFVRRALTDIPLGAGLGVGTYGVSELIGRLGRGRKFIPTKRHAQAEKLGIELTPAQKYEDRSLHQIESMMESDPGYSKSFQSIRQNNQDRANEIAAKTIGIDAKTLTDDEMGKAAKKIRDKFNEAKTAGESVTLDDQWLDDIANAESKYNKAWGAGDKASPVVRDALEASESGTISPSEYQYHYSRLGKKLDTAGKQGDYEQVEFLSDMRQALDDVLDRSHPNLSSKMQEARNLFKNKLLLEKPGVVNTATGDVSPLVLANKLNRDIKGYVEGGNQSDLYTLARVSQNFKQGVNRTDTATNSKTLFDIASSPFKESLGNVYLSGRYGSGLLGGTSGTGAKYTLPGTNALLSSDILDLWREKE